MDTWTLERAKNGFSEVGRRALDDRPQLVTRGGRGDDAVVVLAKAEYERLIAPTGLVEFLRASPLREAVESGELVLDGDQTRDLPRDVDL